MILLDGIEGLKQLPRACAVSIGNYDGIHIGHRAILARLRELAGGADCAVVTFEPHPLTVLRPELAPPRLTTTLKKRELLAAEGVKYLVTLPPTAEVLNLPAEDFWAILRDTVQPTHIVEGPAFNFGKGRSGSIGKLIEWSRGTPVQVHQVGACEAVLTDRSLVTVSSSLIRWLLSYGRVKDADACLGRPYALEGVVVQGFQRGRTIGVPTINLDCGDQHIPAEGVYVGQCAIDGKVHRAAVSIGTSPTFKEQKFQLEAHLLDFTGDLYGRRLSLDMLTWLRDQVKYPSIELLKEQLARDIAMARGSGGR